jgi:hypothetical protein
MKRCLLTGAHKSTYQIWSFLMGKKRKPQREVELEDIISTTLNDSSVDPKDIILKSQLALEALLIEHILTLKNDESVPFEFPKKCEWLVKVGAISEATATAYLAFNKLRNDCIHIFGYTIDISKLKNLTSQLEQCGVDFSDSPNNYNDEKALEYYDGIRGICAEIGYNLLFHQATHLNISGGRDLFSG